MRQNLAWVLLAACAVPALAQEFEVVSVKPNKTSSTGSHSRSDQGRLTATNLSLKQLITMAYRLKEYQIEGPDWLSSERFDIAAKFPEALSRDPDKYNAELGAMMQKMLIDRFRLTAHRDQKNFLVYGLVIAKGGIKFKEAPPGDPHKSTSNNNHYQGAAIPMTTLAEFLARRVDLPVIDMTGLKGFYDLTLDWVPEANAEPKTPDAPEPVDAPAGPTIPVALQDQLGLKLESRKAPIEILIVDHAEKLPTEN